MIGLIKKYYYSYIENKSNTTITDTFKPIYLMLSLIGMFPYEVGLNTRNNDFVIFKKTLSNKIFIAGCNLVIILSLFAWHIYVTYFKMDDKFTIMNDLNYIVQDCAALALCVLFYAYTFINRSKYVDILNALSSAWKEVPFLHNTEIPGRLILNVNILLYSIFVLFALQFVFLYNLSEGRWIMMLHQCSLSLVQITHFVSFAYIITIMLMVIGILINVRDNIFAFNKKQQFESQSKREYSLKRMEIAYVKAYDVIKDLNECFEAAILLLISVCFHSTVTVAHIMYRSVMVKAKSVNEILSWVIWTLFQYIKLYTLVRCSSLLKKEGRRVGQALHKITTEDEDMRLLLEIQHFARNIRFREMVLTVHGYFVLDATIIYNIVSAAMTYFIILVQFDDMNEEENIKRSSMTEPT